MVDNNPDHDRRDPPTVVIEITEGEISSAQCDQPIHVIEINNDATRYDDHINQADGPESLGVIPDDLGTDDPRPDSGALYAAYDADHDPDKVLPYKDYVEGGDALKDFQERVYNYFHGIGDEDAQPEDEDDD